MPLVRYVGISDQRGGAAAIGRFLRPVAFQGVPDGALPPLLKDANPEQVLRRVNGSLTTKAVPR